MKTTVLVLVTKLELSYNFQTSIRSLCHETNHKTRTQLLTTRHGCLNETSLLTSSTLIAALWLCKVFLHRIPERWYTDQHYWHDGEKRSFDWAIGKSTSCSFHHHISLSLFIYIYVCLSMYLSIKTSIFLPFSFKIDTQLEKSKEVWKIWLPQWLSKKTGEKNRMGTTPACICAAHTCASSSCVFKDKNKKKSHPKS